MRSTSEQRKETQIRTYRREESVVFLKTKEAFGGLSNMASGFPLSVNDTRIRTSEALYQACRFPHLPEVQRLIIEQKSPMTAKMKSKPHRKESRTDWDYVRVKIMRWCLRVKLAQNWRSFRKLLLDTGDRAIVEQSRKDDFWGAKPIDEETLVGMNVLGRLLMELREAVRTEGHEAFRLVEPLDIPEFLLLGRPIGVLEERGTATQPVAANPVEHPAEYKSSEGTAKQASLFNDPAVRDAPAPAYFATPAPDAGPLSDLGVYPAMKDSGVPWLGAVPEHWEMQRLRNLADMRVSNVDKHTKDEEQPVRLCNYVDVYKNDYIRPSMHLMRATATKDEIERFRLSEGDVLITKDSEAWNDIGVPALVRESADDLVSGYHLALLRPFQKRIGGEFLFRSLESTGVQYQFHVEANGVTRYGLSHAAIKSVWIAAPPLPEQTAIVRFLDHADRRIGRYIRAKQKLIKLLEEQKQAIIHRAVTRGLDPNVRLKPSGVEWLGDVPEHWNVTRLKFIAPRIVDCLHATPVYCDDGAHPAIRTADVRPGALLLAQARRVDEEHYRQWTARMAPSKGDILYTREGERFGIAALVPPDACLCISQRMMVFRIHPDQSSAYMMWQINCQHVYAQAAGDLIGAAAPHVNISRIKNFQIVLPPRHEQDAIVAAIQDATEKPSAAIARARDEIALLREFRTRLIADVATGKLDVREAAAKLANAEEDPEVTDVPDEPANEEEVPLDDLDMEPDETEA